MPTQASHGTQQKQTSSGLPLSVACLYPASIISWGSTRPHASITKAVESAVTVVQRLVEDDELYRAGASFIEAPKSDPAYKRLESSLMMPP